MRKEKNIQKEICKMTSPVVCNHCSQIYDLCGVKVVHRYADCTLYRTPCCDKLADDREYKSLPDFKRLTQDEIESIKHHGVIVCIDGYNMVNA